MLAFLRCTVFLRRMVVGVVMPTGIDYALKSSLDPRLEVTARSASQRRKKPTRSAAPKIHGKLCGRSQPVSAAYANPSRCVSCCSAAHRRTIKRYGSFHGSASAGALRPSQDNKKIVLRIRILSWSCFSRCSAAHRSQTQLTLLPVSAPRRS